ncbi:tRNA (34-2'-O)-methyltransferase regulator WDR6-like isoform X2 [Tubulanus polymorphus]|uniref:tRNA (34-2'-O)-methyltransferase regulator WDR6-like isoform X2 n=1 Tax=Tubulanus polymorphus TaxID=672921 RepID=UPI003DA68B4D
MDTIAINVKPIIGPITALEFVDSYILVGCGPNVQLFDCRNYSKIACFKALPGRNVHGLKKGKDAVCVYGQKASRIVRLSGVGIIPLCALKSFSDWIHDVCWLKGDEEIAVALSHNRVLLWCWNTGVINAEVQCEETCILYCAKFIGDEWANLVLAAGTVFNQIVLWKPKTEGDGEVKPFARLTSHKGVIFSICYHEEKNLLASVSDDRGICLWQLQGESWEQSQFTLLHTLFGHTARVWDVKLLALCFVSIGEDATCCVWDYAGNVLRKFKGHQGKSIWSLAVSEDENYIATGGGDSSLRLWNLCNSSPLNIEHHSSVINYIPTINEKQVDDFPRSVCFWDDDTLLVMTNNGCLYRSDSSSQIADYNASELLFTDGAYRSYSILSKSPTEQYIVIANLTGQIKFIFKDPEGKLCMQEENVFNGKTFGLCWCDAENMLLTGPYGHLVVISVVLNTDGNSLETVQIADFKLPHAKQPWVSASTLLPDCDLLICGDRNGTIHVYQLSDSTNNKDPIQSFHRLHGKAGVTSLCYHEGYVYSTGRDGCYRKYEIIEQKLNLLSSNKVHKGFDWIDKILFTSDDSIILGFHTSNFVVWSLNSNQRLVEINCGGGHRTWDFHLAEDRGIFVYVKTGEVVYSQQKIDRTHKVIVPALHGRELTNIKFIHSLNDSTDIFVTSGEGTSVNLISISSASNEALSVISGLQGHISSVKAISILRSKLVEDSNAVLIFTGGGRAQMKCWRLRFDNDDSRGDNGRPRFVCQHLTSHMLCYKGLKRRKPWKTNEYDSSPETRYVAMTILSAAEINADRPRSEYLVGAACSDGLVRIFVFNEIAKKLVQIGVSPFHEHCVLCMMHYTVKIADQQYALLVSAATDGRVAFWNVMSIMDNIGNDWHSSSASDNLDRIVIRAGDNNQLTPTPIYRQDQQPQIHDLDNRCFVGSVKTHQSGVNSLDIKQLSERDDFGVWRG